MASVKGPGTYTDIRLEKNPIGGDEVVVIDTPAKCREFIKSMRFGPRGPNASKITFLQQEDGRQLSIDEASDAQVEQVAMELAEALNRASAH